MISPLLDRSHADEAYDVGLVMSFYLALLWFLCVL